MTNRPLPHSIEAEEYLLSCCLLDGADVIARACAAGIGPSSFYDPKHAIIFDVLCYLRKNGNPTEVSNVGEELKATGQLDRIGGFPFLAQVSGRVPTTAQAEYFLEKVLTAARRREMIRAAEKIAESLRDEANNLASIDTRIEPFVRASAERATDEMPWGTLLAFKGGIDPECLMGRRYLGRGGGAVIVAPSGMGKSVLSVGFGACATLGRHFFGLQMVAPMRVLYVQAEDDIGDVAEAVQGFIREHGLKEEDVEQLKARMRIVRWNDAAGHAFLDRLAGELKKHPADLVIINPLFSFCGCNVSEQGEMSAFLRNGINVILNRARAAAVIVHHTNKPPTDGKDRPDANTDLRYSGSGSAELTNWARAYITLQPVKGAPEGVCKMVFAKRGTRAGIVDESGELVTSVTIQHSRRGLCWIPSDYRRETTAEGKFKPRFDLARACEVYDADLSWADNELAIALDQNMSRRQIGRKRQDILDMVS